MKSASTKHLQRVYDRFNARDIEAVIAMLHPDVMWANGMEGGHIHGHDGIRDYWTRQWSKIDPHVEPAGFATRENDRIEVDVHAVVHDLKGNLLSDKRVRHIFQFEDGLIGRFDIS